MTRCTRMTLTTGAAVVAALSLAFGSVTAGDDVVASDDPSSMAPMGDMEPGLSVTDAWTRESPMVDLAGAAYMVIHNGTDAADALIGVSSPAAGVAELHLSSMDDEGMMSMNQVSEIPLPAHDEAVLEPGSYHVMLIDLVEPLTPGMEVRLDLQFMTAEPQTVSAPVMATAPMTGDMDAMPMGDETDRGQPTEEDEG